MKGMRNIAPFGLRMPDELREAVAQRAMVNGRSMNAEIVVALEAWLKNEISEEISEEEVTKIINLCIKNIERKYNLTPKDKKPSE